MKRISSGRPESTRLHNKMDIREGKTTITCGLCGADNPVTIAALVRLGIKFSERSNVM